MNFTVDGLPAAQGSKHAYVNKYTGRAALVESSAQVKPWRERIYHAAKEADRADIDSTGPFVVHLVFNFARPSAHYRTGRYAGHLRHDAPLAPATRASKDIDKLSRAVLDALTGVVWNDDSQVVKLRASKAFAATPGVAVVIYNLARRA